ncbi:MAG: hypothetical protein L0Y71_12685 [Gemmataceae bacterium]|nr:hypothetical protein [Gemmataceae bacterium]
MGDEHDSWFKPFGFDPKKFAEDKLKAAEEKYNAFSQAVKEKGVVGAVKDEAKAVIQKVETKVSAAAKAVTGGGAPKPATAPAPKPAAPTGAPSANGPAGSVLSLKGSVGAGGVNNPDDVKAVQKALGISDDGKCGGGTIGAIKEFQKTLGHKNPDGRVDVGGATARALAGKGGGGSGGGAGGGAGGDAGGAAPAPDAPPAPAPTPAPEDDSFLGGLKKKFVQKLEDGVNTVKDLPGKVVKGVTDLGGKVADGVKGLGGGAGAGGGGNPFLNDAGGAGAAGSAAKGKIKIPLDAHDIPLGSKLKGSIELAATISAKLPDVRGPEISLSKDGLGAKAATKIWESEAKLTVGGVDLFAHPEFSLESEAKAKGVTVKVSFATKTPIGKLGASFTLFELKTENLKSPTFGSFGGKLEGVPNRYKDQNINGIRITEIQITYDGEIKVAVDLVKILAQKFAEKALEKGAQLAAEGGAAAGGAGAGAAAVAAAPLAGIIGGVVGGFALTVAVCAAIGKLKSLGEDAVAVCNDGAAKLDDYARSYASTMHGKPGSNAQGNQDAETRLQHIMKVGKLTHDEAVEAAKESDQNYGQQAMDALVPHMRAEIIKGFKDEHTVGMLFAESTLMSVLNNTVFEGKKFRG